MSVILGRPLLLVQDSGRILELSNSPISADIRTGIVYRISTTGKGAIIRFGGTVSRTNGGFDLHIPPESEVLVLSTDDTISTMNAVDAGIGRLFIEEIDF